jgi:hypothetical protein
VSARGRIAEEYRRRLEEVDLAIASGDLSAKAGVTRAFALGGEMHRRMCELADVETESAIEAGRKP